MVETNNLKERLESTFITRPFNIGYVPIVVWEELDQYCKKHYDDNRRKMVVDLMSKEEENFQHELLWAEIRAIIDKLGEIDEKLEVPKEVSPRKFRTFGSN